MVYLPDLNVPNFRELSARGAVEVAAEAIRALSAPERIVVGSSFGAFVALHALGELAGDPTRWCTKLVLLAPALNPWDPKSPLITTEIARTWREKGVLPLSYYPEQCEVPVHVKFLEELEDLGVPPRALALPTLVVHGRHDEVVHVSQSEQYAASNSHARLELMNDSHELMTSPDTLVAILTEFIEGGR
jgi:hypothetical protein